MNRIVAAGLLGWIGAGLAMGETVYKSYGLSLSHNLGGSPQVLDVNDDGIDDFSLRALIVTASPFDDPDAPEPDGFPAFFYLSGMNGSSFSFDGTVAIADGSEIGSSSPWSAANSEELASYAYFFNDGNRTYTDLLAEEGSHTVGVRFSATDGTHYGWIRYRDYVGAGDTEFGPQVFDLAYNSVPDQPILSAIVPVPEPGTTALVGLGALAFVGRIAKRRSSR